MPPQEWQAHLDAHSRKEARQLAWEARLHGLKHRSGRMLSADDFLPPKLRARAQQPQSAAEMYSAFAALGGYAATATPVAPLTESPRPEL